jgi:hypothetical protein
MEKGWISRLSPRNDMCIVRENQIVGCGFNRTIYILVHQTMHPTMLMTYY